MSSGSWSNRRSAEATNTQNQSVTRSPVASPSSVGVTMTSGAQPGSSSAVTSTYSSNSSAVSLNVSTKSSPTSSSQQQQQLIQQARRIFKIIVIGDANVGKTCLTFRFCGGKFLDRSEATIGVDFREKTIQIDDEIIKLQIWDTAGQDRFRKSMIAHYYRNVHAVIFVYDVTNQATFESLPHWIDEYNRNCSSSLNDQTIPKILVGNKCDLNSEMRVNTSVAQTFADMYSMPLFETSAKDDSKQDHVDAIFMTLALKLKNSKPFYVPELHKVKAQSVSTAGNQNNSSSQRRNDDESSPCSC